MIIEYYIIGNRNWAYGEVWRYSYDPVYKMPEALHPSHSWMMVPGTWEHLL